MFWDILIIASISSCFMNMSRYVLKQRKYAGEESLSKKPRLDVPEAKPEKISPKKEKTEFVERTKSSETSIPETKPFIKTNEENQSPAINSTAKAVLPAGATASGAGVAELGDISYMVPLKCDISFYETYWRTWYINAKVLRWLKHAEHF